MAKRPSIDDYMTAPELVKYLDVPTPTAYHWMKTGRIPFEMLGPYKVILKTDAAKQLKKLQKKAIA